MKSLFLALALSPVFAVAAPYPATSTSVLTDPAKGVLFHGFGFRLKSVDPTWTAVPTVGESVFETMRFEPKVASASEATLSIRMDKLPEKGSLETYAKKWMRDYPSYGFEVLGTKNLQLGGGKALLVDLTQKAKNRQLRQVIMQKDEKIAILTCLDKREKFNETLQTCNRLIRGFEWVDNGASEPALVPGAPSAPTAPVTR